MYEDLYDKIREHGFIAGIVVNHGEVLGIEVEASALQIGTREIILKELCGDEFSITGFPNEEIISITLKQTTNVRNYSATIQK